MFLRTIRSSTRSFAARASNSRRRSRSFARRRRSGVTMRALAAAATNTSGVALPPPAARPELLHSFAADELVRPIVPFERPVLFVVLKVARGVERVESALWEDAAVDRFDFDLERALR